MSWDSQPVIITVAPVDAEVTRDNHPGVSYTPQEIAAGRRFAAHSTDVHRYRPCTH